MSAPGLGGVDRDGALLESIAALPAGTRRSFLAIAGGSLAALVFGAGVADAARARPGGDREILNFALTLEYLQAAFYTEAERIGALKGVAEKAAAQIGSVERAHVAALRGVLGASAARRPAFDFRGITSDSDAFLRTAVAFEDLGTAAYKGVLPEIDSDAYRAAAVGIHTVEARHAAWIRYIAGETPASKALDEPVSRREAARLVASTRFVVARPSTGSRRAPTFTG